MTNWIDSLSLDDEVQFDLLVDNELNEQQRQRLLAHMEGEPERWRLLALRFIEQQMVREGLTTAHSAESKRTQKSGSAVQNGLARRHTAPLGQVVTILAMTLIFLCGFFAAGLQPGSHRQTVDSRDHRQQNTAAESDERKRSVLGLRMSRQGDSHVLAGRSSRVPLRRVRTDSGRQFWSPRRRMDPSQERVLHRAGLAVMKRPGVVRMPVSENRYVMMPAQIVQVMKRERFRI